MVEQESIHALKNTIDQLRRQRDDLIAANNRYLARARKAEADLRWWRSLDYGFYRRTLIDAVTHMAAAEHQQADEAQRNGNRFEANLKTRLAEGLIQARGWLEDTF